MAGPRPLPGSTTSRASGAGSRAPAGRRPRSSDHGEPGAEHHDRDALPERRARRSPQALAQRARRRATPATVEHVVVDGGSTDGTLDDPRVGAEGVRFISEPDRGLSDAVNKGIRMASGDVIGWLNADDVYLPGRARARRRRRSRPRRTRCGRPGRCLIIDADGDEIRGAVTALQELLPAPLQLPPAPGAELRLLPVDLRAPRARSTRVGLLDERFKYSMDYDLWLRLGRAAAARRDRRAAGRVPHGGGLAQHDRVRAPVRRARAERARARRRASARGRGRTASTSRLIVAIYRRHATPCAPASRAAS